MAAPIAMTPGYYSGVDGYVGVGTTQMSHTKWSGKASCPSSDRTNGKSGGYRVRTRTVKEFTGTFSCVVPDDATGDPEIQEGNTYPAVFIAHDGRGYALPIYIETVEPSSEVAGDLGFDVTFSSNGVYVPWTNADIPTGTLSTFTPAPVGQGTSAQGTV